MNHLHRAALAACLLSVLPAGARAQGAAEPIAMGQRVTGTLQEADPTVFGRGRFRAYRFEATAGQRVVATLESEDFDAYLIVSRVVGPLVEEVRSNDDAGESTNARLRVTIPHTGTYLVVAQALEEEGLGGFTLALDRAPDPVAGPARPLALGQEVAGELAETDAPDEEEDRFYDAYTFAGRAGQRITVRMSSEDFDTFVDLGRMQDGEWVSIATDDDGGDDTDSRLSQVLEEDGQYVIRATSYSDGTGAYTLRVDERVARAPAPPRPLQAGQEVTGELDENDAALESDGSYYDLYSYQGRAGEQLRIRMDSEDFDAFVGFGTLEDCGDFREITSGDDGGEGTNTLLEVTLERDGEYVIRANSYRGDQTGTYTLVVESSRGR